MPSSTKGGAKGRLKIFMGYAPGVGKTYQMLDEAVRRKSRGQDVVMGMVEARGRPDTEKLLAEFESIPSIKGAMDVQAVLARKPEVALVDQLQHSNAEGSRNAKRWQDIEELLDAGIHVLTTLDVIYLESLNDTVAEILGERVTETVPDHLLHDADEVELVDLTPRALLNRIDRGIVNPEALKKQPGDVFSLGTLSALRELAMREAASRIDEDLVEYRREKRVEKPWAAQDRVLICISPTRSSLRLIRRGWRMGKRMHGEVLALHVEDGSVGAREQKILDDDFKLCERLGIETHIVKGHAANAIVEFAKERNVTQLILGHPERSRVQEAFRPSILSELARAMKTVDILVVATETGTAEH